MASVGYAFLGVLACIGVINGQASSGDCSHGQKYNSCGSSCPPICGNLTYYCIEMCNPTCECPQDRPVLVDSNWPPRCVNEYDCPNATVWNCTGNSECSNDGICVYGSCVCPDWYSGSNCGSQISCDAFDCQNGGRCSGGRCHCQKDYSGTYCDYYIGDGSAGGSDGGGYECKHCMSGRCRADGWCQNGNCLDTNMHGRYCDMPCSSSCSPSWGYGAVCDQMSGGCLNGCVNGSHGLECDLECPMGCEEIRGDMRSNWTECVNAAWCPPGWQCFDCSGRELCFGQGCVDYSITAGAEALVVRGVMFLTILVAMIA